MRVKFNTFDTHSDLNNVLDIEGINFRKISYSEDMLIKVNMLDPTTILGNLGDTGILLIEDDDNNLILFNNNVILTNITIQNVKEVGLSFKRYSYEFDILKE